MIDSTKSSTQLIKKGVPLWRKIIGYIIIIASISTILYFDIKTNNKVTSTVKLVHSSYELPTDTEVDEDFNDELVLLKSTRTRPHPSFGLTELDFDLRFASQMRVKREVQYCQWDETISTIEGKEEYTYTKGWIDHLVDDSTFNKPENHYNPQRNPFPSRTRMPRKLLAGTFLLDKEYFELIPAEYEYYYPTYRAIEALPVGTRLHGFYYADHDYYYSDYNLDSPNSMLKRDTVTFMDEKNERLQIFQNNCTAGDIRIRFGVQKVPFPITILGIQHDHNILSPQDPITNKSIYINVHGEYDQNQVINYFYKYDFKESHYIRLFCGATLTIGMLILYGIKFPFLYLPHFLRSLSVGILVPFYLYSIIIMYYYGFHDSYTYQSILYLILPTLLFCSLNTLYKYILIYKYYLKYIKPEEDKKIKEQNEKKEQ